jgi:SNF2 family DNA or RNA helicase
MLHRVWRMGQDKQVDITILIFKATVETDIWNTVKNKETMADLFMRIKGD